MRMALTANDIVIFAPPTDPIQPFQPPKGTVIVAGANPEIIWQDTGVRSVYTGIAAPAGVTRTAAPPAADFLAWMSQLVEPNASSSNPNPNGRARGIVREVLLVGDPPSTLVLIVQVTSDGGGWYLAAAVDSRIVT